MAQFPLKSVLCIQTGSGLFRTVLGRAFLFLLLSNSAAWPSSEVTVVVKPEVTRAIEGISELDRRQTMNLCDQGSQYDRRMAGIPGAFEALDELDIQFGRQLGLVKPYRLQVKEDPLRPGYADLNSIKVESPVEESAQFKKRYGPNLNVVLHDHHNAYPDFMGKFGKAEAQYQGKPEFLPMNIDAAAEFAAFVLEKSTTPFSRPAFFEPINEPAWPFWGESHLADWHLAVRQKVRERMPEVQVGGYCQDVSYFYRRNYALFDGFRSFMKRTEGKLDFYSFHAYDYLNVQDGKLRGSVQSGLPLEGVLDLIQNFAVNTFGRTVGVVLSEHGGYIPKETGDPYDGYSAAKALGAANFPGESWEDEMKRRSVLNHVMISSVLANTLVFMDHPHVVRKAVPFILPTSWNWDAKYYAQIYVPKGYRSKQDPITTDLIRFYQFFRDVRGRRVVVSSSESGLQSRAFVDGKQLYLVLNNLGESELKVNLQGLPASKVNLRRLGRNADYTTLYQELECSSPDQLLLAPREAVLLMATTKMPIKSDQLLNEVVCYGDKVTQTMPNATFKIQVPSESKAEYAVLRIGLSRPVGKNLNPSITFNGQSLNCKLEHGAERYDDGDTYGMTKLLAVPVDWIRTSNTVQVSFEDCNEGSVGSAVLRLAIPQKS